ncbi:MAG: PepSY-like domain-containing protein [Puia sp.]
MKKYLVPVLVSFLLTAGAYAQDLKTAEVSENVKSACQKKFPESAKYKVAWEKEKGNYEANWGGKSGEDNSAQFTPSGDFVEIVHAFPVSDLPPSVAQYVKVHYNGASISEAGKVTDAKGKQTYEAEVKGKDLIFDLKGNYLRKD